MSSRRRILSLLPALLLFWSPAAHGMDAAGEVRGSVTWQGEVRLAQPVTVVSTGVLTIAAGTVVRPLSPDAKLTINGVLKVAGTEAAPVIFAAPAGWQGIEFNEAGPGSDIDYAVFTGAATGLSSIATGFVLRHSTFRDGDTAVKLLREATPLIEENLFSGNRIGIDSEMKSVATIRRNRFLGQTKTAILLSRNCTGAIEGNRFEQNKQGIGVLQKYPDRISDNHFIDNEVGIYCNQTQETPRIVGNTFEKNRVALANFSLASPAVENNLFAGNEIAIRNDQFGSPRVAHNLFRGNGTALYNYRKSNPLIEKNRIEKSQLAIFCDYSSYPNVHHNNFSANKVAVKLGIYQSGDWERQFGSQPLMAKETAAHKRRLPLENSPVSEINDSVDVRNNWWGDDTASLTRAGGEGNLDFFFDRRDQPRVFYEGFGAEGYVFDTVQFAPWLTAPVTDGGLQN